MLEVLVIVCVVVVLLLVFVMGILVGGVGVLLLIDKADIGEPVLAPIGEEPPVDSFEVFDFPS